MEKTLQEILAELLNVRVKGLPKRVLSFAIVTIESQDIRNDVFELGWQSINLMLLIQRAVLQEVGKLLAHFSLIRVADVFKRLSFTHGYQPHGPTDNICNSTLIPQ
jgi:hypothetical protein